MLDTEESLSKMEDMPGCKPTFPPPAQINPPLAFHLLRKAQKKRRSFCTLRAHPRSLRSVILAAKKVANHLGLDVYLVGGPLRDILLNQPITDLDFVVAGDVAKFSRHLARSLKGEVLYYPQFMTARIIRRKKKRRGWEYIDLARTRKEVYEGPGKLPKVSPATIAEDLKRRDFTINAIAYDIKRERLVDPLGGERDLKKGVIRVLHSQSFIDDPTRILRAIRFAVRFGFKLERNTHRWMKEAIRGNYLLLLSGERFLNELRIIMKEERWLAMIKRLREFNIFKSYFGKNLPKRLISKCASLDKNKEISPNSCLLYILSSFDTAKLPLRKEEKKELLCYQKVSLLKERLAKAKKPSTIYRALKDFPPAALNLIKRLVDEKSRKKIEDYLSKYCWVKPHLTGKDFLLLGVKPRLRYGEFLRKILERRLDGKIRTKRDELAYLKKLQESYE